MVKKLTEKDISELKLEDILTFAVKSEIEAQLLYEKIDEKNSDKNVKSLIDKLIDEEQSHEDKIRSMFNDFFPEKEIEDFYIEEDDSLDSSEIKDEDYGVNELLERAIEKEKGSSEFYHTMSEKVDKEAPSNLLSYLAHMENEHHSLLQRELSGRK